MSVRDTSIDAYHDHVESGAFSRQQNELLKAMRGHQDYSRSELSEATGIRLSSVCGAVFELIERGILAECPTRPCKITGRTIHPVTRANKAAL
jgi:predicted transcriptional regulator